MRFCRTIFLRTALIFVIFSCVFPFSAELYGSSEFRTITAFKRQYINLKHIGNRYGFRVFQQSGRIYMRGKHHSFSFLPEKKTATFNGVQFALAHAIYNRNGTFYVSKMDYDKALAPLINRKNVRRHKVRTVFLDPGHGGKDVGAEGNYYYEKRLTLILASKVRFYLRRAGFNVIMSRRADVYLPLQSRAAAANRAKADIFVSIHFNSTVNKKVYGIESYCMTPAGAASTNGKKIDRQSYPGNRYDNNNFALAYLMQRSMLANTKALDRGVKHARFLVLKEVNMPAVLVECGFLSNPNSERLIGTDRYLNQVAKGIAQSIINYKKVAESAALK